MAQPTIEFFYDYASPFSYLADQRMPALLRRTGAALRYRPAILGVLIVESKNTPPPSIPAKIAYYQHDLRRWAQRLDVPMNSNPFFPVRSINLMRAALAAEALGCFERFHPAMWKAMWVDGANLGDAAVLGSALSVAGLDAERIIALSQQDETKAQLKANCDEALARGAFGLPTFFVGDEMFFGNDRVDFVEEAIAAQVTTAAQVNPGRGA